MTREEAIKILDFERGYFCDLKGCQEQQAYTMAIKALEREPCDDCISREEAIRMFADDDYTVNELRNLPPVTPQPEVGRWEWVQYDSNPNIGNWHCSECRTIIPHMPEETDNTPIYKWCPMCGAKMEVED